jgi:hypothetical protein
LVVITVAGGREPGDLLLVALPLALLAGRAIAEFVSHLRDVYGSPSADDEGAGPYQARLEIALLLAVLLVLLVTLSIWLASFSRAYRGEYVWVTLSPVGLILLVSVLYGFWAGWGATARAVGATVLVVLVAFSVSLAWGFSLDFSPDRQAAVVYDSGAYGMRSLPESLEKLSSQEADDPHELIVNVVTEGEGERLTATLGWALREFRELRWTVGRIGAEDAPAVVSPAALDLPLGETYAGQDFPLVATWAPTGLSGKSWWRWLLYREATAAPPTEDVVLWVRTDGLEAGF